MEVGSMKLRQRNYSVNYSDTLLTDKDRGFDEEEISEDSSAQEDIVVVNQRRRKVQVSRTKPVESRSKAEEATTGSILRYTMPNVKNTNATCISPKRIDLDDDDDDDFVELPRSDVPGRKRKVAKISLPGAREVRKHTRRCLKISYKEDSSSSDDSSYKEDVGDASTGGDSSCEEDTDQVSTGSLQQSSDSEPIAEADAASSELPNLSDFAYVKSSGPRKVTVPGRRRLTKLSSSRSRSETPEDSKETSDCLNLEDPECDLQDCNPPTKSRKTGKQCAKKMERTLDPKSEKAGLVPEPKASRVSLRRSCAPKCLQEKYSDDEIFISSEVELPSNNSKKSGKSRPESLETTDGLDVAGNAQGMQCTVPKFEVDAFGLSTGKGDRTPLVKRVGQVDKILSVRNRKSDSPVYCVKETGKSYRSVVNVPEAILQDACPQLLRNFWKRMDDLERVDGNTGDREDSPAFNPLHIQVDRIVAVEQEGRRKYYLVKWRGLSYSEATWELQEHLMGDKDAVDRFVLVHSKALRAMPASSELSFKDGRVLRDYQEKGLAWMDHNFQRHVNCILADEMGLGKTMQSVAMLQNLRVKRKIRGPFLVIAPVSTLGHWQREVESLTDMNCVVYSGSMEDRDMIKKYEFYHLGSKSRDVKFNVLLTSFEILMKDQSFLSKQNWQYIVVDEAHRLKSKDSKTTRTLKQMTVKKGGLLLLTGTPVQNNTKEIFSLLNLLDPEKFSSEEEFLLKYGDIKNAEQVRDLQDNILKPRLLRRMKEDVEKSIPQKEETIIWVELTKEQRSYYRAIYENRISDLLKGSQSSNIPNLWNVAMELRKLCNHPFLCNGLQEDLTSKLKLSRQQSLNNEQELELSQRVLCQTSGKMLLLDKLLPMLKNAGRRVLVFSQFAIMLDLLEDYLTSKGYSFERIDGSIRGLDRQAAIDRYSARDSDTFIFLLSTRAGGLGITLTAADTCIIYDSDWNPQNDLQAMARCHRIGQTKDVKIYRLITRNTYEQHLFECSSLKYGLDEAILGNMQGASCDIEHSKNIESLLKRGAYDILKDDGEAEAAAFHDQNIDQILESRTQKRLIGGRGNNTFSVATFISNPDVDSEEAEDKKPDLNTNSMQFWQELLPDAFQVALNIENQVQIPSRRRAKVNYKERRAISDGGSSDGGSSDEEDRKPDSKKRSASKKCKQDMETEDGVKQWSEKELKRLESRLIMLGTGRTEQIMVEAGVEHHGLAEVQQVAETLIQLCRCIQSKEASSPSEKIKSECIEQVNDTSPHLKGSFSAPQPGDGWNSSTFKCSPQRVDSELISGRIGILKQEGDPGNSRDKEFLRPLVDASGKDINMIIQNHELPKLPSFAQKAMSSQAFTIRIQKNASRYLQTIHEREALAKALSADGRFLPPPLSRTKKLPLWWTEAEDLDLMIGAHKHGHRDFYKIRDDKSLCFASRLADWKSSLSGEGPHLEDCSSVAAATNCIQNPVSDRQEQKDGWPHDSVLISRLKKLIEGLPNGVSDRERKRKEALSEAARKRAQEARAVKHSKETSMPSLDRLGVIQENPTSCKAIYKTEQPEMMCSNTLPEQQCPKEMSSSHFQGTQKEAMLNFYNSNPQCRILPPVPSCKVSSEQREVSQIARPTLDYCGNAQVLEIVDNTSSESEDDGFQRHVLRRLPANQPFERRPLAANRKGHRPGLSTSSDNGMPLKSKPVGPTLQHKVGGHVRGTSPISSLPAKQPLERLDLSANRKEHRSDLSTSSNDGMPSIPKQVGPAFQHKLGSDVREASPISSLPVFQPLERWPLTANRREHLTGSLTSVNNGMPFKPQHVGPTLQQKAGGHVEGTLPISSLQKDSSKIPGKLGVPSLVANLASKTTASDGLKCKENNVPKRKTSLALSGNKRLKECELVGGKQQTLLGFLSSNVAIAHPNINA